MWPLCRRWLPSALLLLGVAWQVVLVVGWDHSSWGAGAGFGMYARLDAHPFRVVRVDLTLDGEVVPAKVPSSAERQELEWQVLPTEARGQRLAEVLGALSWRRDGELAVPSDDGVRPSHVRVELVTVDVDRARNRLDARSKRVVELEVSDE